MTQRSASVERLPLRRNDVIQQPFGDELVLCDEVSKRVHVLNQTAALVWEACDGVMLIETIVQRLALLFCSVDQDIVEKDVKRALEQFHKEKLLDREVKNGSTREGQARN